MNLNFLASPWFTNIALFLLALLWSLMLTPVCAYVARRFGVVAMPIGGRHIHKNATPLGGGVAIFLAYHGAFLVFQLTEKIPEGHTIATGYPGFLLASLILLVVGIVDDARHIKPLAKLSGQIIAATCVFFVANVRVSSPMATFFILPFWLDYLVTVFWIVLVINAFNLIDGMDGLAAGLAAIIALGTAGMQFFLRDTTNAVPYLILAGTCIGFLRYNFNPASVFLGDTGSMFIGLTLAVLPLATGTHKEFLPAVTIPLLMMGIPFFDTMVAVWRRGARSLLASCNGQSTAGVMSGDKDHVHHRVLGYFASQRKAAFFLYGVTALLVLASLAMLMWKTRGVGVFLIVFMLITALVVRHLSAVELWDTGRLVLLRTKGRQWHRLRVPIYIAADFVSMAAAWFVARGLLALPVTGELFRQRILFFILPIFIMLLVFRVYNRTWTRARPHEFATIPCAVAAAGVMTFAILHLFDIIPVDSGARDIIIYSMVVCWPLLGLRMFSAFLRDSLGVLSERRRDAHATRAIVFGCGARFTLFLYEHNRYHENRQRGIVGLLDDDLLLKDRLIAGFKVFGPLEALPLLVGKTGANEIIVTPRLTPERREDVLRAARQMGCRVVFFMVEEKPAE